ncbi:MAG TPA: 50S ribosomal protein L10 [Clostridia bacterium]|nr:50S ribosomal protein L10 [Clostridia bacterium]
MAVTKAKKIEQAGVLAEALKQTQNGFVTEFGKLTVAQDDELRKAVRSAGGRYQVVKNTLAERAATGTAFETVVKDLKGRTSIAYTSGDIVALAKALTKYAKDNPEFTFKAGVVEGRAVQVKDIESLANLPSKEELYSKLLYMLNAPATRLASALAGVGRNLAVVVNQGVKENKFQGGEAASA